MTDDEIHRTMEFILQQQAQFTTDMIQMREEHAKFAAETRQNIGRLGEAVLALTGMIGKLAIAQDRTEQKVAQLAEAQIRTDERLNAFIAVVERYISEHRNGKN
jgi:hypothetical protein